MPVPCNPWASEVHNSIEYLEVVQTDYTDKKKHAACLLASCSVSRMLARVCRAIRIQYGTMALQCLIAGAPPPSIAVSGIAYT